MNYLSVIVSFCNHWPNKLRLVTMNCFLLEGDDDGNVINIINVSHESWTQPAPLVAPQWHSPWSSLGLPCRRGRWGWVHLGWMGFTEQHLQKARSTLREDLVPTAACQCQWHMPLAWPIPVAAPAAPVSPRAAPSPTPTARAAPATVSATRSHAVPRQRWGHPRLSLGGQAWRGAKPHSLLEGCWSSVLFDAVDFFSLRCFTCMTHILILAFGRIFLAYIWVALKKYLDFCQ